MADAGLSSHRCPFSSECSYIGKSIALLLSHLRAIHSNDAHFFVRCGIECCCYSAKSFSALYSHIYPRHSSYIRRRVKGTAPPLLRKELGDSCLELASHSDHSSTSVVPTPAHDSRSDDELMAHNTLQGVYSK